MRYLIFYDFKAGLTAAESARRLADALGDDAPHYSTVRRWYATFTDGGDANSDPRSGRPREIDRDAVKTLIEAEGSSGDMWTASHTPIAPKWRPPSKNSLTVSRWNGMPAASINCLKFGSVCST